MDLIKCPRCGEEFSPSYRKCPFCEEGDHPRRAKYNGSKPTGRRVNGKNQTYSARGAMACVLVVVLVLLGWALFGDRLFSNSTDEDQNDINTEQNGGTLANDDQNANADDNTADPDGDTTDPDATADPDSGTPPDITGSDPSGSTGSESGDGNAATPTVDPSTLSVKTNVGTTLPKDVTGNFDCTIGVNESIRLSIGGTDAAVTWAVADGSILSVSEDGKLTPIKAGTTTVTATVGGATLNITVRVK